MQRYVTLPRILGILLMTTMGYCSATAAAYAAPEDPKPSPSSQQGAADPAPTNPGLRDELMRMVKVDQEVRGAAVKDRKNRDLWAKMTEVDRKNTSRMKEIVKKYGWPGKSLVGKEGANAAWLLVQHADRDRAFQKECLPLLQAAAATGEAARAHVAYLTDRVLVGDKKPQVYATQFTQNEKGEMVPQPMEDEANVDKRRKEMGLPTLEEYKKVMRQVYGSRRTSPEPKKR